MDPTLVIRDAQLEALRTDGARRRGRRLYFRMSTRALPFGLESLASQIDLALAEAARLRIEDEEALALFTETVFCRLGGFHRDDAGVVTYPLVGQRILTAAGLAAGKRVALFAEWAESQKSNG